VFGGGFGRGGVENVFGGGFVRGEVGEVFGGAFWCGKNLLDFFCNGDLFLFALIKLGGGTKREEELRSKEFFFLAARAVIGV